MRSKIDFDSIAHATAVERQEVVSLCQRLGFGFVMAEASREWIKRDPIGAFTVGDRYNNGKASPRPLPGVDAGVREECAKVANAVVKRICDQVRVSERDDGIRAGAVEIRDAIRALGGDK